MRSSAVIYLTIISLTVILFYTELQKFAVTTHKHTFTYISRGLSKVSGENSWLSASPRLLDSIYGPWRECILSNISHYRNDHKLTWLYMVYNMKNCEGPWNEVLEIKNYRNHDETKRHVLPVNNDSSVIVSFGIGQDVAAEEKLKNASETEIEFFGADPIYEVNAELFRKIGGSFFNFAISGEPGIFEASVLVNNGSKKMYTNKIVPVISLIYFLNDILKRKFYDNIWIDAEEGEFGFMHYFYKGEVLDQNDITVCQFNMEIHRPTDERKKLVRDFFFQLLEDRRYIFIRGSRAGRNMRVYFFNVENERCLDKYVKKKTVKQQ